MLGLIKQNFTHLYNFKFYIIVQEHGQISLGVLQLSMVSIQKK